MAKRAPQKRESTNTYLLEVDDILLMKVTVNRAGFITEHSWLPDDEVPSFKGKHFMAIFLPWVKRLWPEARITSLTFVLPLGQVKGAVFPYPNRPRKLKQKHSNLQTDST